MAVTLVQSSFPALEEVALGCLVPDPKNPGQDIWPQTRFKFSDGQIYKRSDEELIKFLNEEKSTKLRLSLTSFFSNSVAKKTSSATTVFAATAVEYVLRDPIMHFKKLCREDRTKEWIEEMYKEYPLFLIVGYTVASGVISESKSYKSTEIAGAAELPITSIVSHGATEMLPTHGATLLDVGAKASTDHKADIVSSSISRGERILGVKYRKIVIQSWLSRNADKAKLTDNQWYMFSGPQRSESPEIIEVGLVETMQVDDLELEDQTHTSVSGNGMYVFVTDDEI
jgi:hypothetical protein